MNPLRSVSGVLAAGLLVLGLAACSSGERPSAVPQTPNTVPTVYPQPSGPPAAAGGAPTAAPGGAAPAAKTVRLTTADGLASTLEVVSCTSPAEASATLSARSNAARLDMQATDGRGSATYTGIGGERTGTVESIEVGSTGTLTASGRLAPAAAGGAPSTFQLTGQC